MMSQYVIKQNIRLANGMNEWITLNTESFLGEAVKYARWIADNNGIPKSEIGIIYERYESINW